MDVGTEKFWIEDEFLLTKGKMAKSVSPVIKNVGAPGRAAAAIRDRARRG